MKVSVIFSGGQSFIFSYPDATVFVLLLIKNKAKAYLK
jgi:hypothetical protein